jgi:hypothetical protein
LEDLRKYFWWDKWQLWWENAKFDLNYKIYLWTENWDRFFDEFEKIKKKLPKRFLFVWNAKNFELDDKIIWMISDDLSRRNSEENPKKIWRIDI